MDVNQTNAISRCLQFIASQEALIEDPEFHTRLGVFRYEAMSIAEEWPEVRSVSKDDSEIYVNNALNEICNGVHLWEEHWEGLALTHEDVRKLYTAWLNGRRGGIL